MQTPTYMGYNDDVGPSPIIWGKFPIMEILQNPSQGLHFFDHFLDLPTGKYTLTQSSAGTIATGDEDKGVAIIDTGDTTEYHGPSSIQLGGTSAEWILPAAGRIIRVEARIKPVTAMGDFFFGISETDTTILATSSAHALSTSYHVGFKCATGDRVLLSTAKNNSTEATNEVNGGTALTLATYYKIGFVYDGVSSVKFYLDGDEQLQSTTTCTTTHLPETELRLGLASLNYTTTRCYIYVDWVRVGVEFGN